MRAFGSAEEMLAAHELMFGPAGRTGAELVLKWSRCLFAVPIDPLTVRVVLAPVELGPYNKHMGYHSGDGQSSFILGNRHQCAFCDGQIAIRCEADFEDFIVHELTHRRQAQLLQEHNWPRPRPGAHRDRGWYTAVSEASINYLGVEIPDYSWPTGPRARKGHLDEKDMTHWPNAIRTLAEAGDERLIYYMDVDEDEAA